MCNPVSAVHQPKTAAARHRERLTCPATRAPSFRVIVVPTVTLKPATS